MSTTYFTPTLTRLSSVRIKAEVFYPTMSEPAVIEAWYGLNNYPEPPTTFGELELEDVWGNQ